MTLAYYDLSFQPHSNLFRHWWLSKKLLTLRIRTESMTNNLSSDIVPLWYYSYCNCSISNCWQIVPPYLLYLLGVGLFDWLCPNRHLLIVSHFTLSCNLMFFRKCLSVLEYKISLTHFTRSTSLGQTPFMAFQALLSFMVVSSSSVVNPVTITRMSTWVVGSRPGF